MSKIDSGQAPSTLIPKYLGSDFDIVVAVADALDEINALNANIQVIKDAGEQLENLKALGSSVDMLKNLQDHLPDFITANANKDVIAVLATHIDGIGKLAAEANSVLRLAAETPAMLNVVGQIPVLQALNSHLAEVNSVAAGLAKIEQLLAHASDISTVATHIASVVTAGTEIQGMATKLGVIQAAVQQLHDETLAARSGMADDVTVVHTARTEIDAIKLDVQNKANDAAASRTQAYQAASDATTAKNDAAAQAALAKKWANLGEDVEVVAGQYSSMHWAKKAQASAHSAAVGATFKGGFDASQGVFPTNPTGAEPNPYYRVTVGGTLGGNVYAPGDFIYWDSVGSTWFKVEGGDAVSSVNGKMGAVTLTAANVGALPASGGTLTGALKISGATPLFQLQETDMSGSMLTFILDGGDLAIKAGDTDGKTMLRYNHNNDNNEIYRPFATEMGALTGSLTTKQYVDTQRDGRQPLNPKLTSISGLTGGEGKIPVFTGADTLSSIQTSPDTRSLMGAASTTAARGILDVFSTSEVLQKLAEKGGSIYAGDEAPTVPEDNPLWFCTKDGHTYIYFYDGTSKQWVDAAPSGATEVTGDSLSDRPLGAMDFVPLRTNMWIGWQPADGQMVSRALYPELAKAVEAGLVPVCTEAEWSSDPSRRGCYTVGDGSTTIRLPDYNGKSAGSYGPVYQGGDGVGAVGGILRDQLQNIVGALGGYRPTGPSFNLFTGAFSANAGSTTAGASGSGSTGIDSGSITFDASRVARTGDTTRPITAVGCWAVKVSGSANVISNMQLASIISELTKIRNDTDTQITAVKDLINTRKATCLVNATGTGAPHETVSAALPANIASNTRYVLTNPFGANVPVECWAEVFWAGKWAKTGWMHNSGGYGAMASYVQGEGVIVQTGAKALLPTLASDNGGGHGQTTPCPSAPCRVFVRRIDD